MEVKAMDRNERADFALAVKRMSEWCYQRSCSYINAEEAEPFVKDLPEFWREPARVMACCGSYASADEWMKQHTGE